MIKFATQTVLNQFEQLQAIFMKMTHLTYKYFHLVQALILYIMVSTFQLELLLGTISLLIKNTLIARMDTDDNSIWLKYNKLSTPNI